MRNNRLTHSEANAVAVKLMDANPALSAQVATNGPSHGYVVHVTFSDKEDAPYTVSGKS